MFEIFSEIDDTLKDTITFCLVLFG